MIGRLVLQNKWLKIKGIGNLFVHKNIVYNEKGSKYNFT